MIMALSKLKVPGQTIQLNMYPLNPLWSVKSPIFLNPSPLQYISQLLLSALTGLHPHVLQNHKHLHFLS